MSIISVNLNPPAQLAPCQGERYREGDFVACAPGCVAHFGPNQEFDDYIDAETHDSNTVLAWTSVLAGTRLLHEHGSVGSGAARAYRNDVSFTAGDGAPATVWVVAQHEGDPGCHFAALFTDEREAAAFMAVLADEG